MNVNRGGIEDGRKVMDYTMTNDWDIWTKKTCCADIPWVDGRMMMMVMRSLRAYIARI